MFLPIIATEIDNVCIGAVSLIANRIFFTLELL